MYGVFSAAFGILVLYLLIDRVGRKICLLIFNIGMTISFTLYFYLDFNKFSNLVIFNLCINLFITNYMNVFCLYLVEN